LRQSPFLSVIVAAHNEEACLGELFARLDRALTPIARRLEMIFVDDGSTDGSFAAIERLARTDARVRGLRLARNEGHQIALLCGLDHARGDLALTIDADLQHPPECVPEMVAAWRAGSDVVHMRRRSRLGAPLHREVLADLFYRAFNRISDVRLEPRSTDFRLVDRRGLDALRGSPDGKRLLRATARRLPGVHTELGFDAPARHAGTSSYGLLRLASLALHALAAEISGAPGARASARGYRVERMVEGAAGATDESLRVEPAIREVDHGG
jgi:polyisoprenyl-phosphate glycosyltransferase